jgi:DNA transposition AAA+ family ATPase
METEANVNSEEPGEVFLTIDGQPPMPMNKKKHYFGTEKDFAFTQDAKNVLAVCSLCQQFVGLGIAVGRSGYGKTYALKQYARRAKVCYLECDDSMTCRDLIEAVEKSIGIPKGSGTIWNRVQSIKDFFNINSGYLLIFDEADKLMTKFSAKKMEILRTIFDQCDVGCVIAGEPNLEMMLKAYLPRFANRADYFIKLEGLKADEIKDYLKTLDLTEKALEELIRRGTSTQASCFRLLSRTLKNLIRMKPDGSINEDDIRLASNMMML